MGTMFADAPIRPTVAEVQVLRISFDAPRRYCRRVASTNIRPVDGIGRPMADLNVCDGHAGQLVQRARMKNLEVSTRD
jgi:hypothetical protein